MKVGIYSLEGCADLGLFMVEVFHASPWSSAHTSDPRLWRTVAGQEWFRSSDGRGLVQLAAAQHGL